ncbi:MAG: hypothetical protein TEF_07280 [Rhizobiales bacterium NRL2]|mgnify:CR=1 FL=1|jgi:cell division septation protein DedD|nr:MAG: hypothetical protein TEF_07280 [Rhizobiales bacterium NRL2]
MARQAEGQGRWRLIAGFVLLIAVMAFALVAWFGFRGDEDARTAAGGQAVPIVRAPDGPDREKPEDPGGVDVPDRDKQVYDTFKPAAERGEATVERLLPAVEAPLAEPEPEPEPEPQPAPVAETAMDTAQEAAPADAGPESAEPAVVVEERPAAPALEEKEVAPRPAPPPARPEPAAKAEPKPAPQAAAAAPAAESDGPWQVQIAALREEADATATWQRVQRRHEALLGDLRPTVTRVDTGANGVFYRLRTGGFASREAALAFCARLKDSGQDCIAVKR